MAADDQTVADTLSAVQAQFADDDLAGAESQLAVYAQALSEGIRAALPGWVVAAVTSRMAGPTPEVQAAAEVAGAAAAAAVGEEVTALLAADVDAQRENPLAVLRRAVRYPTEVLRAAGAEPVDRDDFAIERFPDDVYDLAPASFADIHPDLQAPGLNWGAAKAFVHRRRHGPPG